mgnify:CR=1 FL=1
MSNRSRGRVVCAGGAGGVVKPPLRPGLWRVRGLESGGGGPVRRGSAGAGGGRIRGARSAYPNELLDHRLVVRFADGVLLLDRKLEPRWKLRVVQFLCHRQLAQVRAALPHGVDIAGHVFKIQPLLAQGVEQNLLPVPEAQVPTEHSGGKLGNWGKLFDDLPRFVREVED